MGESCDKAGQDLPRNGGLSSLRQSGSPFLCCFKSETLKGDKMCHFSMQDLEANRLLETSGVVPSGSSNTRFKTTKTIAITEFPRLGLQSLEFQEFFDGLMSQVQRISSTRLWHEFVRTLVDILFINSWCLSSWEMRSG